MESGLLTNHRSVIVTVGRFLCEPITGQLQSGWAGFAVACEAEIAGGVWATSQSQVSYSQGGQGSL
jgi:hypothetical protein